jgi:hypothetical protein
MRTRIAWSLGISLVLFCGALLIQNLRLARQIEGLRIELTQKETPVVASEEPKTLKMDLDELDQFRKNNSELIRLRNKFGLLQNELAELHQQKANLLREKQQAEPALEEKIRNNIRAEEMAELSQQLISSQLRLEGTKAAVVELSKRLKVPEGETMTVLIADLTPNEIQAVRSYNDLQRDLENNRRVVEALRAKLAYEKAALDPAK